jgi:hypothetical protein
MPHHRRAEYLRSVLVLLNTLRHTTGLPHKILLDEAHYCLGSGNGPLIDPDLANYILVTYRISALDAAIRDGGDAVIMVTRETDPDEALTLGRMCRPPSAAGATADTFSSLGTNEAVLLPGSAESHGQARRFVMGPRLTAHVRHRAKYLDMPVLDEQAFVFRSGGRIAARAHSLKEFMAMLALLPADQILGHLMRHDFSRWLDGVFRDHGLAERIRVLEAAAENQNPRELADKVAQAIRARYDTMPRLAVR